MDSTSPPTLGLPLNAFRELRSAPVASASLLALLLLVILARRVSPALAASILRVKESERFLVILRRRDPQSNTPTSEKVPSTARLPPRPITRQRPIKPQSLQAPPSDPLKAFPPAITQRIFALLPLTDLATCAVVSKKWSESQTLNNVWFQHYRRECFYDRSPHSSKWSKRESKQNWRITLLRFWKDVRDKSRPGSGIATPSESVSGTLTPREIREEKWRTEGSSETKIDKLAMREMYKELGGRKARSKNLATGPRDRGGWDHGEGGW